MQYDRFVVATQPRNLAEDVSTHTTISVQFVVDVDPRSVNASTLYVTTGSGVLVPSEITLRSAYRHDHAKRAAPCRHGVFGACSGMHQPQRGRRHRERFGRAFGRLIQLSFQDADAS